MSHHYKYTTDIHAIFARKQFEQLDEKEKQYAHFFSKASVEGEMICLFEVSPEAPAIFALLHLVFSGQDLCELKKSYAGGRQAIYERLIAYCGSFMAQLGNYRSFASTKFVPEATAEEFYELIKTSPSYKQYGGIMEELWAAVRGPIYDLRPEVLKIGQWPNGVTGYYSNNLTAEELDLADELLLILNISELNTHVYKRSSDQTIVIKVCSINQKTIVHNFKKRRFEVEYGFLGSFLRRVVENLLRAQESASNITQKKMIEAYIGHFRTGDIELHKESQRLWVKDIGPIVETNLGHIETYLDPKQLRAYWEGMVAVVDKKASKIVEKLVNTAEQLLEKYIPWPKEFEKDKFLKPDFTSLDVVTFASFDTPRGINIPNYDDIRGDIGFKNVFLANNIVVPKKRPLYLNETDGQLLLDLFQQTAFHQVSYHELLGHGCGKLFTEKDGHFNFDRNIVNPVTGKPVETWYVGNETWSTKFKSLTNPYEECRADSVALYYSCFQDAVNLIQPEFGEEWTKLRDAVWISFVNMGVNVLEFYNKEDKKWMQAHSNGRFVILQVLLEAGQDFITINKTKKEDKDWIAISIDRSKISTVGLPALKNFLLRLNVFKATADLENATKMYGGYSTVNEKFLELREIVLANKSERGLEVKGNTFFKAGQLVYEEYSTDFEGVIRSKLDAHPYFDIELINEWRSLQKYN